MKKKIISNTLMFIMILTFVTVFGKIFGDANNLVSVTVIISILVLMRQNLTKNPLKNFMNLIFINLCLGIFSHIASENMWLGLILNFVSLAGIGYLLTFNLNKMIIVPFGFQYLFMLYTPVTGIDFGKRILALATGAVLIMVVQFIIHRKNNRIEMDESELIRFDEEKDVYIETEIFSRIYKIHAVRGAYAIRIGVLTALTVFISQVFNLEQGRWIVYTVFSLTELYFEHCKIRSKQRLHGTIIGTLIVLILFIFIKDNVIRSMIVLVGGYLDTYTTNYRDKMICVTMSVIASVSLTNGTFLTVIERVGYVLIGVVFSLMANNLIFKKEVKDMKIA